jgi:hypothetical protein
MKEPVKIKRMTVGIIFLLQLLFLPALPGQDQANIKEYLTQRFLSYCESVPREEIFVHTDRESYIAGENLWFSISLFDRKSGHLSSGSKIVCFEILNPENKPVAQKRVRMDKGSGMGQIDLPDTLGAGTYTVRAYTNWMKNFMPYNCFMKDINVFNALRAGSFKRKVYHPGVREDVGVRDSVNKLADPGFEISINNSRSDTLEIFLHSDEKSRSGTKDLVYLFMQTRGKINHISFEKMTGDATKITVSKIELTPGICQIIIFDFKGRPVAERYVFTPAAEEKQLIRLNYADSCATRSKVSLGISIDEVLPGILNGTNISISVTPETKSSGFPDINNYLIFGSEFGILPGDMLKGKKISELSGESIDSFLLNVKSNWINWNTILAKEPPEFKYQMEKEFHSLTGLLLTSEQQLAYPGEFVLLSIPGKVPLFQYSTTNYRAEFNFDIPISQEIQDMVIQPDNLARNYKIYFESSFSDQYVPSEVKAEFSGESVAPSVSRQSINYQVEKIYGSKYLGDTISYRTAPVKAKRFYGKPDNEILLKDFVRLPVMEEVFFEIVPHVMLKKSGSDYDLYLIDALGKRLYDSPTGMLIDGVIIKDPKVIGNLDPEYVERIDVIRQPYHAGDYLFNGIVNVITKSGNFANVMLPEYAIRLAYRVIDPECKFISPNYSLPELKGNRTPDFRNTLYWNPAVKTDSAGHASVEFWTSDIKSDYIISVQGITSDGRPFSLKKSLRVK